MSPLRSERDLSALNPSLMVAGFRQMLPIAAFVLVFGAAYGVAAQQKGVSAGWALAMSAFVFAGAAQFAVLDLWGPELSMLTLALTVLAINARHLLMGASLYPWLRHLPGWHRYGAMVLASDSNWAMTLQAMAKGSPGLGVLVGGGLALWVFWMLGTAMGLMFGGLIADPKVLGLDMVMACFLLAMATAGLTSWRTLCIWGVAGATALVVDAWLGHNLHVVAGAIAGGGLGLLWKEPGDDA